MSSERVGQGMKVQGVKKHITKGENNCAVLIAQDNLIVSFKDRLSKNVINSPHVGTIEIMGRLCKKEYENS